ncbi:MAG: hypothetical protein EZS28_009077 [Streblomastix strix]|uniref:Uncharacterized protein n=1 Tax=Streblomastix strix TaxID=222440 RepID=A0A5J4WMB3_9EUKA|nr:MAG: hypothetical protein EZS28_009077 [Streblomastix strix]
MLTMCKQPNVDLNIVQVITSYNAIDRSRNEGEKINQQILNIQFYHLINKSIRSIHRASIRNEIEKSKIILYENLNVAHLIILRAIFCTASSRYAQTDDDIVHNELRKIVKCSRAIEPEKRDFLITDSPPKQHGYDDELPVEFVILSEATTISALQ